MSDRRSNAICAVIERPDHHCDDDLVFHYFFSFHCKQMLQENAWRIVTQNKRILLSTVKCRKLSWVGNVCRHDALLRIILRGPVEGIRRRGGLRKSWKDSIKDWADQSRRRCCTLQRAEFDGQPSQQWRMSEYANNAWSSRELVI